MFANHRVHRGVTAFQVASRFVKQAMVAFGYDADRIAVNPYFTRVPPEPAEASRDRSVLFVGRLEPAKGLECLLDILGLLREEFQATVVGEGSADYEASLRQRVRSRGLSGKVEFAGRVDNDRLDAYYRAAAVVVVPSLWPEPFGIVGIEAMAHSRPVVAFDVGGISEWLEDGGTGYLVARGDIGGLAGKIDLLLGDRALRERLGRRGHETAGRLFTWERHRERLLAIFPGGAGA
jgi:glycosyltransferase involved in cell wall biosynthesis